jgi:hypothetical protein
MPTEASTRVSVLPPRAGIAMLTLQLRTSQQEAVAAEAELAEIDQDAALATLRAQLEPLVEDRRRTLESELAAARADAAAAIATARSAAARSQTSQSLAPPGNDDPSRSDIALLTLELRESLEEAAAAEAEAARDPFEAEAQLLARLDPLIEERRRSLEAELAAARTDAAEAIAAARREAANIAAETTSPATVVIDTEATSPVTVVIDTEAFATIFATVLATLLDERLPAWREGAFSGPANPAPAKRSFWANARHLDVLLLGLALAIVLVIFAAWLA